MPQRFLRPGIRTSPRWNAVSHRAARLYVAILTLVDDYGRYDGRPAVLWADAFAVWNDQNPESPVSRQETAADCQQLAAECLVEFYEVDGRTFLQVTQWQERARNKSRWPDKRLPMAAETCQNLPPSPSIIDHRSSPSPNGSGESVSELLTEVGKFYKRKPSQRATHAEETAAFEVVKRTAWLDELSLIVDWRDNLKPDEQKFFPQSVSSLLGEWSKHLDRANMAKEPTKHFGVRGKM